MVIFHLLLLNSAVFASYDWPDSCLVDIVRDSVYKVVVNPQLPIYRLHLVAGQECFRLTVFKEGIPDTVQLLTDFAEPLIQWDDDITKELEAVDVNFDGYKDLQISDGHNPQNIHYKFYLFMPDSGIFKYDEQLTDLIGSNPDIDPERKEIKTGGAFHFEYSSVTYKFRDSKLVLIEREEQKGLEGDSLGIYVRTLERLIKDKLSLIKKVTGSLEQIDKEWDKK